MAEESSHPTAKLIIAIIIVTVALIAIRKAVELAQAPAMPSDEQAIVAKLDEFSQNYQQTQNEIRQDAFAAEQKKFLKSSVENRNVENWIGKIDKIETGGLFNGVFVELKLSDNVSIEQDIDNRSPLVPILANLHIGQYVSFSGHLKDEGSLTDSGRTESPEINIEFTGIHRV